MYLIRFAPPEKVPLWAAVAGRGAEMGNLLGVERGGDDPAAGLDTLLADLVGRGLPAPTRVVVADGSPAAAREARACWPAAVLCTCVAGEAEESLPGDGV